MDTLAVTRRRVDEAGSEAERLSALQSLASALFEYDAEEAVAVADEAIALAERLGDDVARTWARHNRAWALSALGHLDEALSEQMAVLEEFENRADAGGIAHALIAVGDIHNDAGDVSTGLEYLERAIEPMEAAGDLAGRGVVLNLTGIALSHEDRHREAAALFEHAESIFAALDDPIRVTMAKINRGFELLDIAKSDSGPPDRIAEAGALAATAIELGLTLGEDGRSTVAYGQSLLALVLAAGGHRDEALFESEKAELVAQEGGFDALAVEIALDRIGWLTADGRLAEARSLLDDVEARSTKSDNRRYLARANELRADLLEALGDHDGALKAYREFHRLDRELHSAAAERRSRLTAARLQVERSRREAELAQMRVAELEALDNDKRDFLASVSHELRTPLAAVLGFATELAESWDVFDPEEARGLVHLIARQSADISSIVDDLLTVTRLEAGTMSIHAKSVDLLEEVGGLVETLGREAGREVGWSGKAMVWADPTRLRQITRNLITNAFRYGGERVRVAVIEEDTTARIEIRDSGGPIPESRSQKMFEPFDRADDGGRTPNSVGLGLAVARSLARMMGGDLVYLHEGGESVFRLTLDRPPAL